MFDTAALVALPRGLPEQATSARPSEKRGRGTGGFADRCRQCVYRGDSAPAEAHFTC